MSLLVKIKKAIKPAMVYGLLFACGFYIYDAFNAKAFDLYKFIFNFIVFTILIVIKEVYLMHKRDKKEDENK